GETPPPPASLRPEIPPALSGLIEMLLQKDPQRRIRSALEASRRLELIKPQVSALKQASATGDPPSPHVLSSEPTSSSLSPLPVHEVRGTPGQTTRVPRRGYTRMLLTALTLAAVLSALAYFVSTRRPAHLRVAVLQPAVTGPQETTPRIDLVRTSLVFALVDSLISMQGITPLDPAQLRGVGGSSSEVARAMAADEVISSDIECLGELCRISLNRIRGSNGEVVWAANFDVLSNPLDSAMSAEAVRTRLRRTYAAYPLRPDTPDLQVGDADYAAFLEIKLRIEGGEAQLEPLLKELEKIIRSSPRFLGAYLWASELSRSIFTRTQERSILEKGLAYSEKAQELAPADPRSILWRFRLLVEADELEKAQALLEERSRLYPGDLNVPLLRSRLAEKRGNLSEAVEWIEEAVHHNPAWQNLYRLADLEYRLGKTDSARTHLDRLLVRVPGNRWGMSKLGQIELIYGDLSRAEEIFLELIEKSPSRSSYTNLGLSRALSGHFREAVEAYEAALRIAPGHLTVLINLADAKLALGEPQAQQIYSDILQRLLESEAGSGLSPKSSMYKAQCLLQLEHPREAVKTTQQTLLRAPEDSEVLYLAAWVYAAIGERHSALVYAERALQKGFQPRWFGLPGFATLHDDPQFKSLMNNWN
ncbi:MAG: tetratricopeptide repeat protein, partial [Acidobacteriota bacterium]